MGIVTRYAVKIQPNEGLSPSLKLSYPCSKQPKKGSLDGLYNYIHIVATLENLAQQLTQAKNGSDALIESFSAVLSSQLTEQSIETPKAKLIGVWPKIEKPNNPLKSAQFKASGETSAIEIKHSKFKTDEIVSGQTGDSTEKLAWSIRIRSNALCNDQDQGALRDAFDTHIKPLVEESIRRQLLEGNALELAANAVQDDVRKNLPTSLKDTQVQVKLYRPQLFSNTKVTISTKTTIENATHQGDKSKEKLLKTKSSEKFILGQRYQSLKI